MRDTTIQPALQALRDDLAELALSFSAKINGQARPLDLRPELKRAVRLGSYAAAFVPDEHLSEQMALLAKWAASAIEAAGDGPALFGVSAGRVFDAAFSAQECIETLLEY